MLKIQMSQGNTPIIIITKVKIQSLGLNGEDIKGLKRVLLQEPTIKCLTLKIRWSKHLGDQ